MTEVRAGIYVRISHDPTGKKAGVTRQDEDCRELCARLGWPVTAVYVDNDVSASKDRVGEDYGRLLGDIESGVINAVVAWHSDRLYRRVLDLEQLIGIVEAHRTQIQTCQAGELDLSTPTGRMLARLLGIVARHEVEHKAERWKRGFLQRRQEGQPITFGPRHFFFERDGQTHRAEEVEHKNWIRDMVLGDVAPWTISQELNGAGVLTTMGNLWKPPSVRKTFSSAKLAGLVVMRGEIIGTGDWEPIYDRATWEAMRTRLGSKERRAIPPRISLLLGILFCLLCETRMEGYRQRTGKRAYRCPPKPYPGCGRVSIAAEETEEIVEAYARAKFNDDRFRAAIVARSTMAGGVELAAEIDQLEARLAEMEGVLADPNAKSVAAVSRAMDKLAGEIGAKREKLSRMSPVVLPAFGEWPDDLQARSSLISVAVGRVMIAPHPTSGGRAPDGSYFFPERIRIEPAA